jgi:hypothetical protein
MAGMARCAGAAVCAGFAGRRDGLGFGTRADRDFPGFDVDVGFDDFAEGFAVEGAGIGILMPGIPGIRCLLVSCCAGAETSGAKIMTAAALNVRRRRIDGDCICGLREGLPAHD